MGLMPRYDDQIMINKLSLSKVMFYPRLTRCQMEALSGSGTSPCKMYLSGGGWSLDGFSQLLTQLLI